MNYASQTHLSTLVGGDLHSTDNRGNRSGDQYPGYRQSGSRGADYWGCELLGVLRDLFCWDVSREPCDSGSRRGYETRPVLVTSGVTCSGTLPDGFSVEKIAGSLKLACAKEELHTASWVEAPDWKTCGGSFCELPAGL